MTEIPLIKVQAVDPPFPLLSGMNSTSYFEAGDFWSSGLVAGH
jgi:hypothetical protein